MICPLTTPKSPPTEGFAVTVALHCPGSAALAVAENALDKRICGDASRARGQRSPAPNSPRSRSRTPAGQRHARRSRRVDLSQPSARSRGPATRRRCVSRHVASLVACFEGFVALHMGDGLLRYFGFRRPTKPTLSGRSVPVGDRRAGPASRYSGRTTRHAQRVSRHRHGSSSSSVISSARIVSRGHHRRRHARSCCAPANRRRTGLPDHFRCDAAPGGRSVRVRPSSP